MKKLALVFAAAAMAVSASAQVTVEGSKFTDNWFIGVQGGAMTMTTHNRWMSNLNPNAGLRIGKNITPIFGLVAEGNVYFNDRSQEVYGVLADGMVDSQRSRWNRISTFAKSINTNLLANVNLSNLFGGYKGEPRCFEVNALYGFGWWHYFGEKEGKNALTSKAALDFAFNLGKAKAWQIFVEPSINFDGLEEFKYNVNNSFVQLNAGVVYKFGNSNGTHNFKVAQLRDQAEIDALNARINALQQELAKKPKEVVKEVVKEAPAPKEVKVENLVFVTFAQGKSALTKEAKAALDGVAKDAHVQIVGTASPEGSKAINDKISQKRADVVADYLKARGVVVDEATGKGVQGNTSNRLAVVYIK